ncbi:MAG: tetratricopeptide repeat-containing protein [Alphaproteobacteria bacterium]|nr:tetratricopeptide repeat-containing protein [Alphaproteobacteria bacterium]
MSEKPTSAGNDFDYAAARAAGWSTADIEWETKSEQAAQLAVDGNIEAAAPLWRETLLVARDSFENPDPRIGTSLANAAFALRHEGSEAAAALFSEARRVWDASGLWVVGMKVDFRARSSLFHLRMEALHRDQYEATIRERHGRFAAEARQAVRALAEGGDPPARGLARWRGEKSPIFGDSRKLLAACLLLVSRS